MRLAQRSLLAAVVGAALTCGGAVPVAAETTVNAFSGGLTSSIPIGVPGFRGIEPKLELTYSSQGGNGFVGVGWSLSGFSTVQRTSPGGGAPRYDATDIYVLDGNVLIVLIPCAQADVNPSCLAGGTHSADLHINPGLFHW